MVSELYCAAFLVAKNEGKSPEEIRAWASAARGQCLGSTKRITRASLRYAMCLDMLRYA